MRESAQKSATVAIGGRAMAAEKARGGSAEDIVFSCDCAAALASVLLSPRHADWYA
jgi:hypothetical protein